MREPKRPGRAKYAAQLAATMVELRAVQDELTKGTRDQAQKIKEALDKAPEELVDIFIKIDGQEYPLLIFLPEARAAVDAMCTNIINNVGL